MISDMDLDFSMWSASQSVLPSPSLYLYICSMFLIFINSAKFSAAIGILVTRQRSGPSRALP